jgi:hypothetical protein
MPQAPPWNRQQADCMVFRGDRNLKFRNFDRGKITADNKPAADLKSSDELHF